MGGPGADTGKRDQSCSIVVSGSTPGSSFNFLAERVDKTLPDGKGCFLCDLLAANGHVESVKGTGGTHPGFSATIAFSRLCLPKWALIRSGCAVRSNRLCMRSLRIGNTGANDATVFIISACFYGTWVTLIQPMYLPIRTFRNSSVPAQL